MKNQERATKVKKMFSLLVRAAESIERQSRSRQEEAKLFFELIEFNRVPLGVNTAPIPGTFGNRCANCGGQIDAFSCNCGTFHY